MSSMTLGEVICGLVLAAALAMPLISVFVRSVRRGGWPVIFVALLGMVVQFWALVYLLTSAVLPDGAECIEYPAMDLLPSGLDGNLGLMDCVHSARVHTAIALAAVVVVWIVWGVVVAKRRKPIVK